jgi:nitrilase
LRWLLLLLFRLLALALVQPLLFATRARLRLPKGPRHFMDVIRVTAPEARTSDRLVVGCAQIAPIWLQRDETLAKVADTIAHAAREGCQLVAFGEALVPGYPFWLERTDGARFNDATQKALYAHYLDQGVDIARGDLTSLCTLARTHQIAVYVGVMERAADRGGHSLYCALVYIDAAGVIQSIHRKLQPTYEERLAWAQGDGHGLQVHTLGAFRVGGLNCYENWLPLARTALYAQGEDLHVSVWPGGLHNTHDLPSFIAKESRSYVIAVSGLMRATDVPMHFPAREMMLADGAEFFANGGTTIVAPDGRCLIPPVANREVLLVAELDHAVVRGERQNFDPVGHYARPDVTRLVVDRTRQRVADFIDS